MKLLITVWRVKRNLPNGFLVFRSPSLLREPCHYPQGLQRYLRRQTSPDFFKSSRFQRSDVYTYCWKYHVNLKNSSDHRWIKSWNLWNHLADIPGITDEISCESWKSQTHSCWSLSLNMYHARLIRKIAYAPRIRLSIIPRQFLSRSFSRCG